MSRIPRLFFICYTIFMKKWTPLLTAAIGIGILLVIAYFISPMGPKTERLNIVIGGDVMFDRHIRATGEKYGYESLLSKVSSLFRRADIAIVNLEGAITENPSQTLLPNGQTTDSFFFTFAPETADVIAEAGIDAVSLANNHTDNFFRAGVNETKKWLDSAAVSWFGDPSNTPGTESIQCINEFCVAFVGYHEFQPGIDGVLADVQRLSQQYPVIVYAHWGEEYEKIALPRVREKARQFVESGALAIIGTHPHVVQDKEWVLDVPIIYSLGNLVFDQYFSEEVMKGQIADLTLVKEDGVVRIEKILMHDVSLDSKRGPRLVGSPIEFPRPGLGNIR